MDHDAAGIRLVGVHAQVEVPRPADRRFSRDRRMPPSQRETARSLERKSPARESLLRQQRRHVAALGGAARMKPFGHRTEHLAQPADCVAARPIAYVIRSASSPRSFAHRHGGAEYADGARAMPARLVRAG